MMNRFFTLLLAASCLTAVGQVPDYVPTEGLVTWYSLDNNLNSSLDSNLDLSATGGGFEVDRHGNEFGAYSFDGESWLQTVGDLPVSGTSSRSFSFWARLETTADVIAISHGDQGTGKRFEGGFNYVQQGVFVSAANSVITYQELESTFNWNHFVLVMEEGDLVSEVSLYQNGVLLEDPLYVQNENVQINTISTSLFLGKGLNSSPDQEFIGDLDDVGAWNRALTNEEILALFNAPVPPMGCTDEEACNYDSTVVIDDGSCHFDCTFCLEGTIWSEELGGCVVANPSDSNFDSCVQLNDLLDLLSAYGDCGAEESTWQCGDPLEYQGYDYETVQIGAQCWFAENLRSESYQNGDVIPAGLSDEEWSSTTSGAMSVYGEGSSSCDSHSPDGDACDPNWSLAEYGRLYNWYAVNDTRGLCPSGWYVPSDEEWMTMEMALGMSEAEANDMGFRGTDQGTQMKTEFGWFAGGTGTNSSGFSSLPGGYRSFNGSFGSAGIEGGWMISSLDGSNAWRRFLYDYSENVFRNSSLPNFGLSVRCIKDSE